MLRGISGVAVLMIGASALVGCGSGAGNGGSRTASGGASSVAAPGGAAPGGAARGAGGASASAAGYTGGAGPGSGTGPGGAAALPIPRGAVGGPNAWGFDCSIYEGAVDWPTVATTGATFAIARIGDGLHTGDRTFAPNWAGMQANGLVRGLYQFFRPSQDGAAQADLLLSQVSSFGAGDLPPFCDVETLDGQSPSQAAAQVQAWVDEIVAKTGMVPAVYTSRRVWTGEYNNPPTSGMDLWVANWGVRSPAIPSVWKSWMFWQYTASGSVAGVHGSPGVDMNVFHGTSDDLRFYAGLPAPAGFIRGLALDSTGKGFWLAATDGGVFPYGDATFRGTAGGQTYPEPLLGIVRTPTGFGYWLVGADGNVIPFGDATQQGNLAGQSLARPVVGLAPTPSGQGYWLVAQDGTISAFGDASAALGQPGTVASAVVGLWATPTGLGYWIASADGNVYPFGDAPDLGNLASQALAQPVVAVAGTPSGKGYWLAQADGSVTGFGDAGTFAAAAGGTLSSPVVGFTPSLTGRGYYLVSTDGTVIACGDAVAGGPRPR